MSIPYINIAKSVMLRANQLKGASGAAEFESNFAGAIADNVDGLEVPLSALKMTILAQEKRIVGLVGRCSIHSLRLPLHGVSVAVANGGICPNATTGGGQFFGTFSGVFDSANPANALTEKTKQEVMRRRRNAGSFYKTESFIYAFDGMRIYHTRPNVFLEGVAWNYETQSTAYNSNGNSPLHPELESFWIADVLANLAQENWFVGESQTYLNLVTRAEQQLLQGVIPANILPTNTAHADPIKE
jgi:hypothetical protein